MQQRGGLWASSECIGGVQEERPQQSILQLSRQDIMRTCTSIFLKVKKGLRMFLQWRWQEVLRAWMCGLIESKVIPRQRTCETGESVEPLTLIESSDEELE